MRLLPLWNFASNTTDKSDFTAQPAGSFGYTGIFDAIGTSAAWLSSLSIDDESASAFLLTSMDNLIEKKQAKGNGCSVRCIRY
jgi:uncharacterized protein (TIGR02145 family)